MDEREVPKEIFRKAKEIRYEVENDSVNQELICLYNRLVTLALNDTGGIINLYGVVSAFIKVVNNASATCKVQNLEEAIDFGKNRAVCALMEKILGLVYQASEGKQTKDSLENKLSEISSSIINARANDESAIKRFIPEKLKPKANMGLSIKRRSAAAGNFASSSGDADLGGLWDSARESNSR